MIDRWVWIGWLLVGTSGVESAAWARQACDSIQDAGATFHEARAYLLDLRLEAAEDLFHRLGTCHEAYELESAYHLSLSTALQAILKQETRWYDRFFARSDYVLGLLDLKKPGARTLFFRAEAHLLAAFVRARRGDYFRAGVLGRRAYRLYDEALLVDPELVEAHRGRGMVRVMVGAVPDGYRWLTRLLGVRGSVQEGLKELRYAAETARWGREEAWMFFSLADLILNQSMAGGPQVLAELYRDRPESLLYATLYHFALTSDRDHEQAAGILRKATVLNEDPAYFHVDFLDFSIGEQWFEENQFAEAIPYFDRFLSQYRGSALQAEARLKCGEALEMLGRRPEAEGYYAAVSAQSDFDSDVHAVRQARRRLAAPMDAYEKTLLRGINAFDGGRYDEAVRVMQGVFDDPEALPIHRTKASYFLGRAYHDQHKDQQALAAYRYVTEHPIDATERWAPWAQFYTGDLYERNDQIEEARGAYRAALAYEGEYDYSRALQQRARAALERL